MIVLYAFAIVGASVLLLICAERRQWPLITLFLWIGAMLAEASGMSPYTTSSFIPRGIYVAAVGVTLFVGSWMFARRRVQRVSGSVLSRTTSTQYHSFMALLAITGVLGLALAYGSTGLPIFQHDIDAVKAAADPPFLVGLLREGVTVGAWLSIAVLFGAIEVRGSPKVASIVWLVFFLSATLVGGSRNTFVVAIVPAAVGVASVRGQRQWQTARARGRLVIFVGLIIAASFTVSGQRILHGTGVLEDNIRAESGGSVLAAGVDVTLTNLAAPIETLGRTNNYVESYNVYGNGKYTTYSLSTVYKYFTDRKFVYDITGPLSFPYYQNVGTMLASPILDGGPTLAYIFAALYGLLLGGVEKLAASRASLAASLLGGYAIYSGLFSVYECLPCIYGTYFAIVPMTLLAQRWLKDRGPGSVSVNTAWLKS